MGTKLFVGNLSFDVIENDLQDLFSQAGSVNSVDIMQDRTTGRSRGFGFVEMATEEDTAKAITMFNGKEFKGRALTVNEARPREERGGGGRIPRRPCDIGGQEIAFQALGRLDDLGGVLCGDARCRREHGQGQDERR